MKNGAGHLNQLRRENFSLASTIHRWLAGGDGEPLWLISGCPGCLYWAVTGRDLVRDSCSRRERARAEDWGREGDWGGEAGRQCGSLGAPWSRYLTQSAPTDSAPSLEKPGLRRSCAASSVKNPHSVFARTKGHSVCALEPASCMCLVT